MGRPGLNARLIVTAQPEGVVVPVVFRQQTRLYRGGAKLTFLSYILTFLSYILTFLSLKLPSLQHWLCTPELQ